MTAIAAAARQGENSRSEVEGEAPQSGGAQRRIAQMTRQNPEHHSDYGTRITRTCSDCGTGISAQSVKGRCRRCAIAAMNADPAYCARRAEANRRKAQDPAYRAKLLRNLAAGNRAWRMTPEGKEALRELGRKAIERTKEPGVREKWVAGRAQAGRKRHETVMAWCPPEYRAEYRRLVSRKVLAADAKAQILAKLTPFERQLHAIRNGARLVEKPVLRSRAYNFTLGGVTSMEGL